MGDVPVAGHEPGWTPPKDAEEALLRGHQFVAKEKRWICGSLFDWDPQRDPETGLELLSPPSCTDVKACSLGILIIVCLDGPALKKYAAKGATATQFLLKADPVGAASLKFLAEAMTGYGTISTHAAERDVIEFNDHGDNLFADDSDDIEIELSPEAAKRYCEFQEHEDRIADAFLRASILAKNAASSDDSETQTEGK